MDKSMSMINNHCWADWGVGRIACMYDDILITLVGDTEENTVSFRCVDYIGISFLGHWDESIIEDIMVEDTGEVIDQALNNVRELYGSTPIFPGSKRLDDPYVQMNIRLIDGNTIRIACKSVELIEPHGDNATYK